MSSTTRFALLSQLLSEWQMTALPLVENTQDIKVSISTRVCFGSDDSSTHESTECDGSDQIDSIILFQIKRS